MKTQWNKLFNMFFPALSVVIAGIIIVEPLATAQPKSQNDVQSTVVEGQIAPRLQNLGNHKFPVTTGSANAQLFINQGLMLTYGFNHAEAIYWQDLRQNRENGWSLFGLMQSLRSQGKEEQAVMIERRFRKAWNRADVTLTASRFMGKSHPTLASTGAALLDDKESM
jgi:hypothetical protein